MTKAELKQKALQLVASWKDKDETELEYFLYQQNAKPLNTILVWISKSHVEDLVNLLEQIQNKEK